MKKILMLMIGVLAVLAMQSCGDDDSEGLTRLTYFPTMTLEGGSRVVWDKGTPWVEPGYTSTLNGEDIADKVTISGNVDVNKSGVYYLTYTSMTNEDGFSSSVTREVDVLDPNDPIEGFWDVDRDKTSRNGTSFADNTSSTYPNFANPMELLIINNGDGTYYVSDLIGGFYAQGRNYGSSYAMTGDVAINGSDITLVDSYLAGWGDGLVDFSDGVYDATAKTMQWKATYVSSMVFNVYITKK